MSPFDSLLRTTVALAAACTLCSCITPTIRKAAHRDKCEALLADGSRIEGRIKLPKPGHDDVRINPADARRRRIAADSLVSLRVWHRRTPEISYFIMRRSHIYYGIAQGGETLAAPAWIVSRAIGPHLSIYARGDGFRFGKDGRMIFEGSVRYLAFRPGSEVGILLGTSASSRSSLRKSLLLLCADDPALCDRLERGEIDPSDFRSVAESYDPASQTPANGYLYSLLRD